MPATLRLRAGRFAMVFVGTAMLLSFAGCGSGLHGPVTPVGTYQITVTAASATVQAGAPNDFECAVEPRVNF